MKHTPKIEKAIRKAATLHHGQTRKAAENLPYITHLFSVAAILSKYTDDEDTIASGLLHDTLEDTDYSEKELRHDFGDKITEIVKSVTEATKADKPSISWQERKRTYLKQLETASDEALLVSCADKIHNLQSIIESREYVTIHNYEKFFWFQDAVYEILHKRLPKHPLVDDLEAALGEVRDHLKNS